MKQALILRLVHLLVLDILTYRTHIYIYLWTYEMTRYRVHICAKARRCVGFLLRLEFVEHTEKGRGAAGMCVYWMLSVICSDEVMHLAIIT